MSKRTFVDLTCREEYITSHKRVHFVGYPPEEKPPKEDFFKDIDIESILSEIEQEYPEWTKMFPMISVNE